MPKQKPKEPIPLEIVEIIVRKRAPAIIERIMSRIDLKLVSEEKTNVFVKILGNDLLDFFNIKFYNVEVLREKILKVISREEFIAELVPIKKTKEFVMVPPTRIVIRGRMKSKLIDIRFQSIYYLNEKLKFFHEFSWIEEVLKGPTDLKEVKRLGEIALKIAEGTIINILAKFAFKFLSKGIPF